MNKIIAISLILSSITHVSCGQVATDNVSNSVETKTPNSPEYKPAFAGQTRIGSVKTQTPYDFKVLTEGLSFPWGIKSLPDGRLLITEKEGGNLRIAKTNGELSKPIKGLPAVNSKGQGGLLGITIDPAFEQNRMIYWSFSEDVDGGTLTSIAKGKLSADESKIEGASVIYRAT
ncbi:MAG: PQQ-dependent sugar dehydrogenase, partial [Arcicella sp.]|nr:PQQ-dependent sugar dehydrogenase [Arcicella sp.]